MIFWCIQVFGVYMLQSESIYVSVSLLDSWKYLKVVSILCFCCF